MPPQPGELGNGHPRTRSLQRPVLTGSGTGDDSGGDGAAASDGAGAGDGATTVVSAPCSLALLTAVLIESTWKKCDSLQRLSHFCQIRSSDEQNLVAMNPYSPRAALPYPRFCLPGRASEFIPGLSSDCLTNRVGIGTLKYFSRATVVSTISPVFRSSRNECGRQTESEDRA